MIKNLIDEILEKIKDNKNKNDYKYLVVKDNFRTNFLIYKNENYLKHPFIELIFTSDKHLHIYVRGSIKEEKTKLAANSINFLLILNQYHCDSINIYKKYNQMKITTFLDYIKNLL